MKVTILGGAGELGANFSKLCFDKGYRVKIIDLVRFNEAWRLEWLGIKDLVEYIWKASQDVRWEDLEADIILDAAAQPDRPLGTTSPNYTLWENLAGPTRILEEIRREDKDPLVIYPSSCNIFLGVPKDEQPLTEQTRPRPTNYYGWSKLAAEELYLTYRHMYGVRALIVRTGSCYGEGMRTDQVIAKAILHALEDKTFVVKSPYARRSYTYLGDVKRFYECLLSSLEEVQEVEIIHNGGNIEDKAYATREVVELIYDLVGSKASLENGSYEIGELIDKGTPVYQHESSELAKDLLGWEPQYTLEAGLKNTISGLKNLCGF